MRKLAEARAKIEARAKERHAREQAEHEAKLAARQAKAEASGKKPRGKPPKPPVEGPRPNDQINLTDEESRIMPVAGGGFDQCYNAQAAVAAGSLLVVASAVSQAPNDKQQLEPMVDKIEALADELGKPECLLADTGYFSAANVLACEKAGIEPLIAMGRQPHHPPLAERFADGAGSAGGPNAGRGDGASAEDVGRPSALGDAQADPRAGVRDHQIGAGIPSVFAARPRRRARRMEPRHHGLEHQAAVRPRSCLTKAEVRRLGRQSQGNPDIRLLQPPSAPNPTPGAAATGKKSFAVINAIPSPTAAGLL